MFRIYFLPDMKKYAIFLFNYVFFNFLNSFSLFLWLLLFLLFVIFIIIVVVFSCCNIDRIV